MSIRITAIRPTGGHTHQHITRLWWTNPANGKAGENARAEIVSWIEKENGKPTSMTVATASTYW